MRLCLGTFHNFDRSPTVAWKFLGIQSLRYIGMAPRHKGTMGCPVSFYGEYGHLKTKPLLKAESDSSSDFLCNYEPCPQFSSRASVKGRI